MKDEHVDKQVLSTLLNIKKQFNCITKQQQRGCDHLPAQWKFYISV